MAPSSLLESLELLEDGVIDDLLAERSVAGSCKGLEERRRRLVLQGGGGTLTTPYSELLGSRVARAAAGGRHSY